MNVSSTVLSIRSGRLQIADIVEHHGLIRAGTRRVRGVDGEIRRRQVFIEFLPHSTTDYLPSLGEGDFPYAFQLMGRLFEGNCARNGGASKRNFGRPAVLEKVQAWQLLPGQAARQTEALDQRLVRYS